jgi:hypothetical protein
MQILTDYQLSELSIGSFYFILFYMIAMYMIHKGIDLRDVIVTSVLFSLWLFMSIIISNYISFNRIQ